MSQPTSRVQFIHYNLLRSGRLSANEIAMLSVIQSYSQRCELKQIDIARSLNKSISTVRRTMNSLITKGLIVRTYTVFKRCVLRLASLKEQELLMTSWGVVKQALKAAKNLMKSSDRSPMSELNRSPMNEPTRSNNLRNKTEKSDLNFNDRSSESERERQRRIENERQRQLFEFKKKYGVCLN